MRPNTIVKVISLSTDIDRRKFFEDSAKHSQREWTYFDALTSLADGLEYDAERVISCWGSELRKGEIGNYSSHWTLWNELLNSDYDQMVVIEDDVLMDWEFLDRISNINFEDQAIFYLRLCAATQAPFRILRYRYLGRSRQLIRFLDFVYGTQAYLITKKGAAKFASHCQKVSRPVDVEMDRFWDHGIQNLSLFPFPALERSIPSRIGGQRYAAPPVPKHLERSRLAVRLREKFLRTAALWSPNPPLTGWDQNAPPETEF